MQQVSKEVVSSLSAEDVLRGQGINPHRASQRLFAEAARAVEEAKPLLRPAALRKLLPVKKNEKEVVYFEEGSFRGELVARALCGARAVDLAICTIGPLLENRVSKYMSARPVAALALDGAGNAALRKLSRKLEEEIRREASDSGETVGMRIQPGQEGWLLEEQNVLFRLLEAARAGITLSPSGVMIPRKSVSFVLPRGREEKEGTTSCDLCSRQKLCAWRRDAEQH